MQRRHRLGWVMAACAVLFVPRISQAWLRPHYEDAQIVDRSTLIVVGHLKAGSDQYVAHDVPAGEGASGEFHATLVITETLKGKAAAKEIPIVLCDGLDVLHAGKMNTPNAGWNLDGFPRDTIQIVDGGSSAPGYVLTADATQDALWFMQQRSGTRGEQVGKGDFGIADPEEIQPLALKDYFMSYLAADAEAAVKAYAAKHADVVPRTVRYLDHLEIQRIAREPDAAARVQRLLPIFLRGCWWEKKDEAQELMTAAGAAAGPTLMKAFVDPANAPAHHRIIEVWVATHYGACVPALVDVLDQSEKFWAQQNLEKGWWNKDVDSKLTQARRDWSGETIDAVRALGEFRDVRARAALEATLKRWQQIAMDDPQMVDAVKEALAKVDAAAAK